MTCWSDSVCACSPWPTSSATSPPPAGRWGFTARATTGSSAGWYWIGFNLVQLGQGSYAFRLDGESPRPLWAMPLQQFVYRQLMYLVVIESVLSALRGTRLRWQHVERTGEIEAAP